MDIVSAIEAVGSSPSGKTSQNVQIVGCGRLE